MKVLITHELFPPIVHGGGEKVVYKIANELKDRGVEVKIVTTGDPNIKQYNGIPTFRIPINRYFMNLAVPQIYKYAKDFDIIQTNNYNACFPSYIAARLLKKPVVCLVHGMYGKRWIKMRGLIFGSLSMFIEKFQICHNYDKILFLSDFARNQAIKIGVRPELTEVLKPGINFKKYKVRKKEPFVLFVGRIAAQKGIRYLVEAAKRLQNVKFILVGRAEREIKLLRDAPPNIVYMGFVSEKELLDLYSRALVFCLPSVGETFGFVILEAMASACSIVSTVPLEYEGFRIEVGNVEQLTYAINYLIKHQKEAIKMGKINREKAKDYRWDKFIDRLIQIYEELLSR